MDGRKLIEELDIDPDGPLHLDCIESPIYADMRDMVNLKLMELLGEIESGDFTGGDLTLKLSFDMQPAVEEVPVQDEGGEAEVDARTYRNPTYDYAVAVTLKKTSKDKGRFADRRKLEVADGRFYAAPVPSAQMTMDELAARSGRRQG